MVKVAVLGYGTVGSGIVEVIKTNQDMVNKKAGDEIDVKYILDLRDFPGDPYENLVVHDVEIILKMCIRDRTLCALCATRTCIRRSPPRPLTARPRLPTSRKTVRWKTAM